VLKHASTTLKEPAADSSDAFDGQARRVRNGTDREELFAHKRLTILRTAARLFNERGFYTTSLNDLAGLLKVTKPALYYYVKNKNDILLQILNVAMQEIDAAIVEAERGAGTAEQKLRMFIGSYTDLINGDFGKCLVLSGLSPLDETSREQLKPSFRRIDRALRRIVRKGVADGSLATADPKIATFAIFGSLHWMTYWFSPGGKLDNAQIAERITRLFLDGLLPRKRAAPRTR
jgi:AcrR family transcriptional regulator